MAENLTFEQYWEEKGHFGGDPEDVARLAWYSAMLNQPRVTLTLTQMAEIIYTVVCLKGNVDDVAKQLREFGVDVEG